MTIPYIPYFTTSRYRVAAMIELAEITPGEKAADLGTGDGRIAIALAKAGAVVTAYELDDERIEEAKRNIEQEWIPGQARDDRAKPVIIKKDFWTEDLSQFSIVCCYPMPTIMGRLEKKLKDELKPGSRVLLNYFPFTHWKLEKTKDNIFLYKKS